MKKKGFTLVEISAAIALLAVCAVSFALLVSLTASERVAERMRQTAIDQAQNVMECLAAVPPERIVAGDFDKEAAESLIERSLPDGKITFDAKKIELDRMVLTVTVSWCNGEQQPRREVSLFRLWTLQTESPVPSEHPSQPESPNPLSEEEEYTVNGNKLSFSLCVLCVHFCVFYG
jgi:prepilin-type N-terminal cleavage/methylation domain-containing protein